MAAPNIALIQVCIFYGSDYTTCFNELLILTVDSSENSSGDESRAANPQKVQIPVKRGVTSVKSPDPGTKAEPIGTSCPGAMSSCISSPSTSTSSGISTGSQSVNQCFSSLVASAAVAQDSSSISGCPNDGIINNNNNGSQSNTVPVVQHSYDLRRKIGNNSSSCHNNSSTYGANSQLNSPFRPIQHNSNNCNGGSAQHNNPSSTSPSIGQVFFPSTSCAPTSPLSSCQTSSSSSNSSFGGSVTHGSNNSSQFLYSPNGTSRKKVKRCSPISGPPFEGRYLFLIISVETDLMSPLL